MGVVIFNSCLPFLLHGPKLKDKKFKYYDPTFSLTATNSMLKTVEEGFYYSYDKEDDDYLTYSFYNDGHITSVSTDKIDADYFPKRIQSEFSFLYGIYEVDESSDNILNYSFRGSYERFQTKGDAIVYKDSIVTRDFLRNSPILKRTFLFRAWE